MHVVTEPAILYLGTPVVVISTVNEDGSYNLAPMSSAFWLGWRGILGLDASSKTPGNMLRTGECVLNLPSADCVAAVNRLALTTGSDPVPPRKMARGYRHERDKFGISGFTALPSQTVAAPRILECPVQLECVVAAMHDLARDNAMLHGRTKIFEVRVQRVHVEKELLMDGEPNRIDPDKWRPLIMSFQKFYGLAAGRLRESHLGSVPEGLYRSPDADRAHSKTAA